MTRLDDIFPDVGVLPATVIVAVIGLALQLSGIWATMLIAGFFGALLTRRHSRSFLAGFVGVAVAWSVLFAYLAATAQALEIAEFFIGLLGLSGLGWLVIVISVLLGGLLGGFGALLGRSVIELVDEVVGARGTHES
ncbi:hypothetical protein EU545_05735 [Candidatus Thorarchaeota archaeon]|nr:MAG: hypothetical protein EU545_05735 [Candidatus Thorarchaeota archaeon]